MELPELVSQLRRQIQEEKCKYCTVRDTKYYQTYCTPGICMWKKLIEMLYDVENELWRVKRK